MNETRREFLKRGAKMVAVGATAIGATINATPLDKISNNKGKKDVLYWKSEAWEKYYKVAQ